MDTGDNERTRRVTILLTPAEYAEVKRRAGLVALGVWIRHTVLSEDALPIGEWRGLPHRKATPGTTQAEYPGKLEEPGSEIVTGAGELVSIPERQKISEPAVESKRRLPRARPVQRKHINLREEEEAERPAKKVRCTYLWPSNSKKCPRCGQVHSDV